MKMNKNDFVNKMQELYNEKFEKNEYKIRKLDFNAYVDAVFDTLKAALSNGDSVFIHGFGTFEVSEKAAREGVNPRTGEKIFIEASKIPKFKAAKGLKDVVK